MDLEDDCKTQVMILDSPTNIKHNNCAVYTDTLQLVDFQTTFKW